MRWMVAVSCLSAFACGGAQVDTADATAETEDAAEDMGPVFGGDADAIDASPWHYVICPTDAPTPGAGCSVPWYQRCEYGTSADVLCNTILSCSNGAWTVWQDTKSCPVLESCPAAPTGACTTPLIACEYPDASKVCVCGICGGGPPPPDGYLLTWRCADPGPSCPLSRPRLGTACALDAGADAGIACRYGGAGCCEGVYQECTQGVWIGEVTGICP